MASSTGRVSRRGFLKGAAAAGGAVATFTIVPSHVLGGPGRPAPSDTFGGALIGCGGRGPGTFKVMSNDLNVVKLADCDVKFKGRADNKKVYTDFRRVLERKDIDLVAIATPPHWHAIIAIMAAEAGKDVLGEKPATRTIAEGRAMVNAFNRYRRVYQVGTFGRFGISRNQANIGRHKLMASGLLKKTKACYVRRGGFKVRQWAGKPRVAPRPVPANLDWDLYVGPSPMKPYVPTRTGGTHRWYWDYDGGGLGDMGQHALDPINWLFAKDDTSPVEIEAYAPPAHPELAGLWGWAKLKYADGFTLVLESGEWGEPTGMKSVPPKLEELSEADRKKVEAMPDPAPLLTFAEAVKTRGRAGGHPEAAHRTACLMHLANIAIRTGRKLRYDPDAERFIDDEEANRLAYQPMRAPWRL